MQTNNRLQKDRKNTNALNKEKSRSQSPFKKSSVKWLTDKLKDAQIH
jgi:hypothetical protein